jgi:hypothetical protein
MSRTWADAMFRDGFPDRDFPGFGFARIGSDEKHGPVLGMAKDRA